jgi:transcriptional regulator with XRE-family HTH domain
MKLFGETDSAIAEDIGDRLKNLRLDRNYSQKKLCELTGLSIKAILNAEKGKSNIVTYIKLLRALNCLDHLENFIPEPGISPMQIVKLSSKKRIRASSKKRTQTSGRKRVRRSYEEPAQTE